ncbi:MAG: DNA repair protein RadC [Bacteroidales bacterium]|nr:DNA repair protein RadC [Bacteroides sp.]MCM1197315.1 DNA repair protein RadC [Clostridium sp.]MCM1503060.1 DNA repair protein RadC [Bacteroidales bacterium]
MKIQDLCPDERPREKMMLRGASSLSNAELIAILLRTGTERRNAIEIAQMLMREAGGSLTRASRMSVEQLCRTEGIGPGKAVGIVAALELGKRMCSEAPDGSKPVIHSAEDIFRELIPQMRGLQHEECWIFYLARNNRIISMEQLSIGGQHETVVDIKLVARRAIDTLAAAVIIAHNHPSGDPRPGKADIELTKTLRQALETFGISLIDHVVIADGRYYSFADERMIDTGK